MRATITRQELMDIITSLGGDPMKVSRMAVTPTDIVITEFVHSPDGKVIIANGDAVTNTRVVRVTG